MSLAIRVLLFVALTEAAWGDTVHFSNRGSEINGTVTFSNGVFHVVAQFKKGPREIDIGRDQVREIRFNPVTDNPEDDAPDWVLHLPTGQGPPKGNDVIRFWDEKDKDVNGILEGITKDEIVVQGKPNKQSLGKQKVRAILLAE